jgi:hypothetical protein
MKPYLPLFIALVLIAFTSCRKENEPSSLSIARSVDAISGAFISDDGDLNYKALGDPASPVTFDRTWTMLARHSMFYGNADFALVKGNEFITGSAAYNYWHKEGNNPITLNTKEQLYSNLTPAEDLRLITESKLQGTNGAGSGEVAYLGMLDFNPSHVIFPLSVHGFRLGDVLQINTDQVTQLPGSENLRVQVIYTLKPINLSATKTKVTLTGITGSADGKQFCWDDIVYDPASSPITFDVPAGPDIGDITVYNAFGGKVTGTITIVLTQLNIAGSRIEIPVNNLPLPAGKGLRLTLIPNKLDWHDVGSMTPPQFYENNIKIRSNYVTIK